MAATGILGCAVFTSLTAMTNIEAAADAAADFTALTIATSIGFVESVGALGRAFQDVPFTSLSGRTYHLKGAYDDGSFEFTVAADFSDAGQAALKGYADAADQSNYPFKFTFVGADASYDAMYFAAKVLSCKLQMGDANTVHKATIMAAINSPIFFA